MKTHMTGLLVLVTVSTLSGLDFGPVVGSRNGFADPDWWSYFGYTPVLVGLAGVRVEQKHGPIVVGLEAGLLGSYAQITQGTMHEPQLRSCGAEACLSVMLEQPIAGERLRARGGLSIAYDACRIYRFNDLDGDLKMFTQALRAGLQAGPFGQVKVGMDVDLNIAREGTFRGHHDYLEPYDLREYMAGTLAPGLSLYALFGV